MSTEVTHRVCYADCMRLRPRHKFSGNMFSKKKTADRDKDGNAVARRRCLEVQCQKIPLDSLTQVPPGMVVSYTCVNPDWDGAEELCTSIQRLNELSADSAERDAAAAAGRAMAADAAAVAADAAAAAAAAAALGSAVPASSAADDAELKALRAELRRTEESPDA